MKFCPVCKTKKEACDFHSNKAKGDGLDWRCKACKHANENILRRRKRDQRRYEKDRKKPLARVAARKHWGTADQWKCAILNCDNPATELHHVDYDKPLDVVPLCHDHHNDEHT